MKTLVLAKGYLRWEGRVSYNTLRYGIYTKGVFMSTLTLKRLAVVLVSQVLGFFLAYLIVTVGFNMLPAFTTLQSGQGRSPAVYGTIYFIVTAVPLGIIVMIWMDAFLDTRILPD